MSLFKIRDYWRVENGSEAEEFSRQGMCVGNIDNEEPANDKIITASLSGNLRIYKPRDQENKAEDLILEAELEAAVLAVETGKFVEERMNSLAVLHPNALLVYSVVSEGKGKAGSFVTVALRYAHRLRHTACTMCTGSFGGSKLDRICVQSMDGELTIFDRESVSFSRHLRNFLLPGPICYVAKHDLFVTCNSAFELEAYRYSNLAGNLAERNADVNQSDVATQKKVTTDWKLIIGELASDISTGEPNRGEYSSSSPCDIVALGERTIFCTDEHGTLKWQRRLDYSPLGLHLYHLEDLPEGEEPAPQPKRTKSNVLISSVTGSIMVHSGARLEWAAKCLDQPLAMKVCGKMAGQNGLICTISEQGSLALRYLGTDPPKVTAPMPEAKGQDTNTIESERMELDEEIERRQGGVGNDEIANKLEISLEFSTELDSGSQLDSHMSSDDSKQKDEGASLRVLRGQVHVSSSKGERVEGVSVLLGAPPPLCILANGISADPSIGTDHRYSRSSANIDVGTIEKETRDVNFALVLQQREDVIPIENKMRLGITFEEESNESRSMFREEPLPLIAVCDAVPPRKINALKITMPIEEGRMPNLCDVFSDLIECGLQVRREDAKNAITIGFHDGTFCTLVLSRDGSKLNVQATNVDAMWLAVEELYRRVMEINPSVQLGMDSTSVPMDEVCGRVDLHVEARRKLREVDATLEKRSHQMRALQKRLFTRFREKSPSPMDNLDLLLGETYNEITQLGERRLEVKKSVTETEHSLSRAVKLATTLTKIKHRLSRQEEELLVSHMPSHTDSCATDGGWVKVVQASVTHLLKTNLNHKAAKAKDKICEPAEDPIDDPSRLKHNMRLVLSRLDYMRFSIPS